MALIRGLGSLRPCPICFVPDDMLSDLTETYPLRTAAETKKLVEEVRAPGVSSAEREERLKAAGVRGLNVCALHPR